MAEYKILKTWELETSISHLLHQASATYYSNLNFGFMVPQIVMTSALGTMGLLSVNHQNQVINLLIGCIGFLSAILATLHNFLNIQKLQATHNLHAVEFNKIRRDIKINIYLSETDVKVYANIAEYIKQVRTKIDKLLESANDIPPQIERRLQNKIRSLREQEMMEVNELIQLSRKYNHADDDIYDMKELAEVKVISNRRKSRDVALRTSLDKNDQEPYSSSRKNSSDSNDSKATDDSNDSKDSKDSNSKDSDQSKSSNSNSSDSFETILCGVQERLSLDIFYKNIKEKANRDSWKKDLKLLEEDS